MKNNISKKYMSALKHNMVYIGTSEKKSLQNLKYEVDNFIDELTTYENLVTHFGEPKVLASYYLEEYDEEILKKKIKYKKILFGIFTIVLIAIIIIVVLVIINYNAGKNSYITREQEIIIEN